MQKLTEGSSERAKAIGSKLKFRGVHHLALNTDDIKMTIDFYAGVLGMRLIHAMKIPAGVNRGNPPFERIRHYFFDMGNDSLLAFFELPKGTKEKVDRNDVAAMQHVAFSITPAQADDLVERLDRSGVERFGPLESAPGTYSTYFFDPNGIRLEAAYQINGGDSQSVVDEFQMSNEELLAELQTVTSDEAWITKVIHGTP
jgi:catechol 2,3-dioxygenase-like lactoylglutathione lyase family enzyme